MAMEKRNRTRVQEGTHSRKEKAASADAVYLVNKGSYYVVLDREGHPVAQGSREMIRKHHPKAVLDPPYPAAPSRLARHELKFEREGKLIAVTGFYAVYAARKFLEECIGKKKVKWVSSTEIKHDNFTVKSPTLETILEHEYTPAEEEWVLDVPYLSQAQAIHSGKAKVITVSKERHADGDKKRPMTRPPREPKPDGLITLAQLCKEMKIDSGDARVLLRKKSTKPDHGTWAWPPGKELDNNRKLLKELQR